MREQQGQENMKEKPKKVAANFVRAVTDTGEVVSPGLDRKEIQEHRFRTFVFSCYLYFLLI